MRPIGYLLAGFLTPAILILTINGLAFGAWFHGQVPDWTIAYAIPVGLIGGIVGVTAATRAAA